jgi:flavodoxin
MKRLVVYFSYTGNTKIIAEKIAKELKSDIEEIIPVKPYSKDYQSVVDSTEDNEQTKETPEINKLKHNISEYDEIIVGSPLWWYTITPPIRTFLKNNNFNGKKVIPFVTNAGWPGNAIEEATEIAKNNGAEVVNPMKILFESYSSNIKTKEEELEIWIENL